MRRVYKNLCPATISASTMAANMWKNSLKNVESNDDKILYENVLDFFLQRKVLAFRISLVSQKEKLVNYKYNLHSCSGPRIHIPVLYGVI